MKSGLSDFKTPPVMVNLIFGNVNCKSLPKVTGAVVTFIGIFITFAVMLESYRHCPMFTYSFHGQHFKI